MARTFHRLTDRSVRALAAPGYQADGGGLYLQVSRSGTKSWIFRFTLNRRTRDMGLGPLSFLSLADARLRASEARLLVSQGIDPIAQMRAERGAASKSVDTEEANPETSFRVFAEKFIDARIDDWKNEKHQAQWRSTLERYAYPVIGDMQLADIDTPDILRVLEPIWKEKSETASRVRGRIERVLAAASVRGLRAPNNPAAWAGHLREALPRKAPSKPFTALSYRQIAAFLAQLRERDGVGSRALEFTILTATRSGEARGARWSEIDMDAKVWTVPAERMKAGRPHAIPLSDRALALLEELKPLRDLSGLVFPGLKAGKRLSDMTLTKLVRAMGFEVTVHGFRASFKTWAEQETEYPNVVIEAALAHIVGDKAERAYMRGDWLTKRQSLMDTWGEYCSSTLSRRAVRLRGLSAA